MSVHGDVVAGDELAVVDAVVSSGVLLIDGDDDQTLLAGDDVLLRGEGDAVPALGLAVVVPLDVVVL